MVLGLACAAFAIVGLFAGLETWDHFRLKEFAFGTSDPEAMAHYEKIVKAHGYAYRHDKNIHGETMVVVNAISARDYKAIDCEFFAWDAKRQQAQGVIVYERKECAL